MSESTSEPNPSASQSWRKRFWWIISGAAVTMIATLKMVDHSGPTVSAVPFFSCVFFFSCVLGGWCGLGSGLGRVVLPAILPLPLGFLVDVAVGSRVDEVLYALVYGIVLFVAFATFSLRLTKGRLVQLRPSEQAADALRFGIKDVMIWTTVVAVLLTIGRALIGPDILSVQREFKLIFAISFGMATATVVNVWAMHGQQITSTKIVVVTIFTILAAAITAFAMDDSPWFFPLVLLVCESLVMGLMYCLRQEGYRFVKR